MPAFSRDAERPRPLRAVHCTLLILVLGACRAPEARPLDGRALALAVEARGATAGELAAALELSGLRALAVEAPPPEALEDPMRSEFWHACAIAWSPATRAARRELEAARALAGSAGRPGPIDGLVEVEDLSEASMHTRVALTFDLIGILGLGPAASARALASAETRVALGRLESALWSSRFEVDAARARLAALRAARANLAVVADQAGLDSTRLAILERHGRVEARALAAGRLATGALEQRLALLEIEESRAREELAVAAGLPPDSPALDVPGTATLDALLPSRDFVRPSAEELLVRLPELRVALLDYAVAEARLRDEAAARWPTLRLGPDLLWTEPDLLLGAMALSGLPWPGSLDGRIAAASAEREAARERTEDALLAARARSAGAEQRLAGARTLLASAERNALEDSSRLWSAARARFAVEPAALMDWTTALNMHAESLASFEEARVELVLAALELERSLGPTPAAPRLAAAEEVRP
jgi:hypothetical protein